MAHAHGPPGPPPGDLHLVGEPERADPGVAVEGGADARLAARREPDGDGVVHPLDVRPDVLDDPPHLGRRGVDHRADPDGAHRRMLRTGRARRRIQPTRTASPDRCPDELLALAEALAEVGRAVRDGVRSGRVGRDHDVVRTEGGDDVFGVDDRADRVLLSELAGVGERWPGTVVLEGYDDPVPIGPTDAAGEPGPVALPGRSGRRHPALPRGQAQRLGAARRRSPGVDPRGARGRGGRRDPDRRAAVGLVAWATTTDDARGRPTGPAARRGRRRPDRRRPPTPVVLQPADRSPARPQLRHRRAAAPRRARADRRLGRSPPRGARGLRRPRARAPAGR